MSHSREFPIILVPDEDGGFVAQCPLIPGCISQGGSRDEALVNIREAIKVCLENQAAEEWQIPDSIEVVTLVV